MAEQGTASRYYTADLPTFAGPGAFQIAIYLRAGGSPAEGDTLVGTKEIDWTGAVVASAGVSLPPVGAGGDNLPAHRRRQRGHNLRIVHLHRDVHLLRRDCGRT